MVPTLEWTAKPGRKRVWWDKIALYRLLLNGMHGDSLLLALAICSQLITGGAMKAAFKEKAKTRYVYR